MDSEEEFLKAYRAIKDGRNNILKQMDIAIDLQENNNKREAVKTYKQCLQLIENVFNIPIGVPDNLNRVKSEWVEATFLIEQIKELKTEILHKLKLLQDQCEGENEPIATCTATQQNALDIVCQYKERANSLRRMLADKDNAVQQVCRFSARVKLYKVESNGVVEVLQGFTTMSLVQNYAEMGEWQHLDNTYFIQCVMNADSNADSNTLTWIYPLLPHVTFCYRTNFGAFLFPDLETNEEGAAFGILLCENDKSQEVHLENLIKLIINGNSITFVTQDSDVGTKKVANHIVNTADFLAKNLIKGAQKTGELMVKATPYVISKLQSAPPNPPNVPPAVRTTVKVAKCASGAAVGVTRSVAGAVGTASAALGRFLAPRVLHYGSNLLQKAGLEQQEAQTKLENTFTLVAGAVQSVSTLMDGVETAAAILGNSLSENSVKIIQHKYGTPAGAVAAGTFETLGNAFLVSRNVNYVLPTGIAKKMLKNTGKVVVVEYLNNQQQEGHTSSGNVLYPELKHIE